MIRNIVYFLKKTYINRQIMARRSRNAQPPMIVNKTPSFLQTAA
jgi:hypothetical protein